ncbi:hypothetical protein LAG90_08195 [Marinilongibacter aquaticus]|uniref:hypothetical protein n=1 Tax=Marinilongibacter aquaticus TaxID=2975157 RepID=UPI0021BD309B|nr:hypothetical protein [Marinilongibacter aquaticus]UBM60619.1 hypothetical protein LAG90_08195 [Marinilongibacter aquaticus]
MRKTFTLLLALASLGLLGQSIDREQLVGRHNPLLSTPDSLASFSVGNGRFAMTVDFTGLQTFPDYYVHGVPLGTLSEWGWRAYPNTENYKIEETLAPVWAQGREVPYARQWKEGRKAEAANFLRENPQRVHLGQLAWFFQDKNGDELKMKDLRMVRQKLDLWTGELHSLFLADGDSVSVITFCDQKSDRVYVKVKSPLLHSRQVHVQLKFPYPTRTWADMGNFYMQDSDDQLSLNEEESGFVVRRVFGDLEYATRFTSEGTVVSQKKTEKGYWITPQSVGDEWAFSCEFREGKSGEIVPSFSEARREAQSSWQQFWESGGIIDFGHVKDMRAEELERRMVLSMYLTKVNCGGKTPPQETGLTYNSWYGKPHMEMVWWHDVHWGLWNRPEILEDQLDWYLRNWKGAKAIAKRQGFDGVRWQKMTDPWGGETASSVGSYLIWQQPHIIYLAELLYRLKPESETLKTYGKLIEKSADFMASYVYFDKELGRGILGPGLIPAQERYDPEKTFNPAYELAYWRWGLETAQQWRTRLGKKRSEVYDSVLYTLSPLPQQYGLYLSAESIAGKQYDEEYRTDHPSVLGTFGMLPKTAGLDTRTMSDTFEWVWKAWHWEDTWGWDFPMTAMTATRLHMPEVAVDALLMPIKTNTYLKNGHNFQDQRLTLYLPGNGGFLAALALMAAGYDDFEGKNPGFPEDWDVRWEGLKKMP